MNSPRCHPLLKVTNSRILLRPCSWVRGVGRPVLSRHLGPQPPLAVNKCNRNDQTLPPLLDVESHQQTGRVVLQPTTVFTRIFNRCVHTRTPLQLACDKKSYSARRIRLRTDALGDSTSQLTAVSHSAPTLPAQLPVSQLRMCDFLF